MKIRIQLPVEYGVLFLYDPYTDPEFPEDTGAETVTSTSSCICFQVTPYVDGEADITISDKSFEGATVSFIGEIEVPTKRIALSDASGSFYSIINVKSDTATVSIWNYIDGENELSWIRIQDTDLF